jgi:hypothetical protein
MKRGSYGVKGQIGAVIDTDLWIHHPLEDLLPRVERSLHDQLPEIELVLDLPQP